MGLKKKSMIKEYNTLTDSFFSIFKGIPDACIIMQNGYNKLTKPQQSNLKKQASETVTTCSNLYAETFGIPAKNTLFIDLTSTLNSLLLSLPEKDRIVIATQIIRRMQCIAPYVNIRAEKKITKDGRLKIGNTTYSTAFTLTHKIIESWCGWNEEHKPIVKNKLYEGYIINCFDAYTQFFNGIDGIFLDYGIDLSLLQQDVAIAVWQRDNVTLNTMGYKSPVSTVTPIKTKTNNAIQYPTIRAFCCLVSDAGIMPIGGKKINQHCRDVCTKYDLTYSVKVSQDYNKPITPQLKQKVQTFILPLLSDTDRQKIEQQINNVKNTYG